MRKKMFSVLVCLAVMVGCMGATVGAAKASDPGPGIMPRYLYLDNITPNLLFSGGKATASGSIKGNSSVTKIEYTVYLQVKSGSSWSNATTWTGSVSGSRTSYSQSASVTSGKTYRTKTVATIYSGSKSETVTEYSLEKTA